MRVLAPPVTCASLGRGTRVTNATQKPIASWRVFDANKRPGYHASTAAVAGSFGFSVRGRRDGNPNMAVGSVTTRAASSRDVDPPRGIVGDIDNLPISINAMSFDESSTGETTFVAETKLPTDRGFYRVRGYRHSVDGAPTTEPVAIAYGEIEGRESVAVRVHDACFTSEVLGSLKCDCKQQLRLAMDYVQSNDGMVIYLHQEGRGIGLANKLAAYQLQDEEGLDTVDANRALGLPDDTREYTAVANILEDMNIKSIRLMTNNPRKVATLEKLGVRIVSRIPCIVEPNLFNKGYLTAKEGRMKHYLDGSAESWG